MSKVLIVETNVNHYHGTEEPTGLWLGEATEFVEEMEAAGIEVDYVSPKGGYVPLDPRSLKYVDESIMSVYSDPDFVERGLRSTLSPEEVRAEDYQAIYYTGGHGVMWDFPDHEGIQELAQEIYAQGGYLLSVCHGIAGLFNLRDDQGQYLIADKEITGFTRTEEFLAGKRSVVPFFNQEMAEARGAIFKKARVYKEYALQDGRLITGQNPFSVRAVARLYLQAIQDQE